MPAPTQPDADCMDPGFLQAVVDGETRLTPAQAHEIYEHMSIQELGQWADARCRSIHGEKIRSYVIDRNINYTNICTAKCTFCAFRRDGHEDDAYTLERDELMEKIRELHQIGGTQVLMQGGMNPELPLSWYLDLLQAIKSEFPDIVYVENIQICIANT